MAKWLQPTSVVEHEVLLDRNHYLSNTCGWILRNKNFQEWITSEERSFLWVHGLPGAGKSVLAAYSMRAIEERSVCCCYFFCKWDDPSKRTASSIIRTIVYQLAQKFPGYLQAVSSLQYSQHLLLEPLPLLWKRLVTDHMSHVGARIYIVLDGLDECSLDERTALLDVIDSTRSDGGVSWLVFSRFLSDISNSEPPLIITVNPEDSEDDLTAFIEQRIRRSRLLRNQELQSELYRTLKAESRGIFLWVRLILDELDKQRSVSGVRAVLRSLPLGMESLYQRILESLEHILQDQQPRIVSEAFGWIACAERVLEVSELTAAIELSLPDIGRLLDLNVVLQEDCGALVTVSTSNLVQFIHQTAQQYICSDRCTPESFAVTEGSMNKRMTGACLKYLCDSRLPIKLAPRRFQSPNKEAIREKYGFLIYAAMYWPNHFIRSNCDTPDLYEALEAFLTRKPLLLALETVLTFGGIEALRSWYQHLSTAVKRGQEWPSMLVTFTNDLYRLICHYGHVLDANPNEVHFLLDERFPRNSHFWTYLGHHDINFLSGQPEDWDPCLSILDIVHVNCLAVGGGPYLAAADPGGISVLDIRSRIEIFRFPTFEYPVVAMTFSDSGDTLAILTSDGSIRLVSTTRWNDPQVFLKIVSLPAVIMQWNESRFWSLYFLHFDPYHINFAFIGNMLFAGNSVINLDEQKLGTGLAKLTMSLSTTQFASSKTGEIFGLVSSGDFVSRPIGARQTVPLRVSRSDDDGEAHRLLAICSSGKYLLRCAVKPFRGHSISSYSFDCFERANPPSHWQGRFEMTYKITCAAFNQREDRLVVNAHDSQNLLDATKIWSLGDNPQLIWEKILFDEHTTSLAFALEDSLLIKGGRYLSVWDTSLLDKPDTRNETPMNLAVKFSHDGAWIAAVPGEQVVANFPNLLLYNLNEPMAHWKLSWLPDCGERNILLTEPLAWSLDDSLVLWDHVVYSVKTQSALFSLPLNADEKICCMGGFSHNSRVIVCGVDRRPPRLRRRDMAIELLDDPPPPRGEGDYNQYVYAYDTTTLCRRLIFRSASISALTLHPESPLLGVIAQGFDSNVLHSYIFSLTSGQCTASASFPTFSIQQIVDIGFAASETLQVALPHGVWREGREFGGAWVGTETVRLLANSRSCLDTIPVPEWHICHFLPSGKVVYFLQDGWIAVWDKSEGLQRMKYLPPQYQWSISAGCTAVWEGESSVRVVIHSLRMGIFWFEIDIECETGCKIASFFL